jgi:hypothetical protein
MADENVRADQRNIGINVITGETDFQRGGSAGTSPQCSRRQLQLRAASTSEASIAESP